MELYLVEHVTAMVEGGIHKGVPAPAEWSFEYPLSITRAIRLTDVVAGHKGVRSEELLGRGSKPDGKLSACVSRNGIVVLRAGDLGRWGRC
jgi:hypothetical protein